VDIAIIELPESWEFTSLESILSELEIGSRPKGGVQNIRDGVPSLGGEHLATFGEFNFNKIKYVPEEFAEKQNRGWIQPNDILIVKDGATTGKTSFVSKTFRYKKALINEHVFRCKVAKGISPEYVFMFLVSEVGTKEILKDFRGAAQGGISRNFAKLVTLPLAPTNEQKRISLKVETLRSHSSKARKALEAIPPLLEKFRQSVLSSAFRGDLTADWRAQNPDIEPAEKLLERIRIERRKRWEKAELAKMKAKGQTPKNDKWKEKYKEPEPVDTTDLPELPEGWSWESLERICSKITDGTHHSPSNGPEGDYMYLTSKNVRQWKLDLNNITYIDEKTHKEIYARCDVKRDDILYVKDGANTGIAALNTIDEPFSLLSSVGVFRPETGIVPAYLMFYLNSPLTRERMLSQIAGIAITRLTLTKLNKTIVAIPPLQEQQVISNIVEKSIGKADSLEELSMTQLSFLSKLDQSILSKAFRGELVPQDPNDEPASKLLERIKQEKTSLEAGKKQRGKAGRKKGIRKKESTAMAKKKERRPLVEVLQPHSSGLSPEELFSQAGFDEHLVDEFYVELKNEVVGGNIIEDRPDKERVILRLNVA
jgi:type I restriction enzyme S subunit